MMAYKR